MKKSIIILNILKKKKKKLEEECLEVKLKMIKGQSEEIAQSEGFRYVDLEEEGYKIGSLGEEAKRVKDQQIAEIDKEQDILVKDQTKAREGLYPSPIRGMIERLYESEISVLWRKITVYEKYATEERSLRTQAVEAL